MMNSKIVKGLLISGAVVIGGAVAYKVIKSKKAKKAGKENEEVKVEEDAQTMSATENSEPEVVDAEIVKSPEEIMKDEVDAELEKSNEEGYSIKISPEENAMIDIVCDLLNRKGVACDSKNENIQIQITTLYRILHRDNPNVHDKDIHEKIEKTMQDWIMQDTESKEGISVEDKIREEKLEELDKDGEDPVKAAEAEAKMRDILDKEEKKGNKKA